MKNILPPLALTVSLATAAGTATAADLAVLVVNTHEGNITSEQIPVKSRDECIALAYGHATHTFTRMATVTCLKDKKPAETFQCGGQHLAAGFQGCRNITNQMPKL